jgi:prepilin-type N-terminal cleavage/methylation domain-containing protein
MSAHAEATQMTNRTHSAVRVHAGRSGFTLIELLIVVVIIGILAAIAIPKFSSSKEKAFVGNMKSDLRNLITAQEGYFYENSTYYNGAVPSLDGNFKSSSPVSITLMNVTGTGWAAIATHPQTARTCAVYYGTGGPLGPAVADGQVGCTP